jgi:hypothetical protein
MSIELERAKDLLHISEQELVAAERNVEYWSEMVKNLLGKPQPPEEVKLFSGHAAVVTFRSGEGGVFAAINNEAQLHENGNRNWMVTWSDRGTYKTWEEVLEFATRHEDNVQKVYNSFDVQYVPFSLEP